jgi:hypothetical protein
MACQSTPNSDGSFNCTLDLDDGSQLAYTSWVVNGVYPEGIGCNPQTGQLYAFDAEGNEILLEAIVDLQTGRIFPTNPGPLPPTNLTVVEVL